MRTYLDSGVLIAAFQAEPNVGAEAFKIIEEANREFVCSEAVRLEVLPGPIRKNLPDESKFYTEFFDNAVVHWVPLDRKVVDIAISEAASLMVSAIDAVHVAAAHAAGADEFVTTENPTKPMCRTELVKVRSLRA